MAVIEQEINDRYAIYNGDCCEVLPQLPKDSIHHCIYSPPFAELYNYSSSDRDLSNCLNYEQFLEHYAFVVEQVYRLLMPGRLTAVHCMDLKGENGGRRDFPGDIIRLHERMGFVYHGKFVIWKEPLRQAIRTRALGLMHRQLVKDSTLCHEAGADYLIVMRKPGQNAVPVEHGAGLTAYPGATPVPDDLQSKYANWEDPKTNKLSHWIWQHIASSVWMDVRNSRVLPFREARETEEEKHVCPLQLDVIERSLMLYSNPGENVLTPFMGVGSEVYGALIHGRRAVGVELKPSYYRQAKRNVEAALTYNPNEPDMVDIAWGEEAVATEEEETA